MRPIKKKSDYKKVMERIEALMNKGSSNVTQKDLAEIRELAFSAQEYEKSIYVVEPPKTLAGMIEMKMYELRLKQHELAKKLHVSNTKLSLILNGKQKPDVEFLKSVYNELHVDADFLLKHA